MLSKLKKIFISSLEALAEKLLLFKTKRKLIYSLETFVHGTLHCWSLRGGVLLDQTQDPDCGQLVQEAGAPKLP